MYDTTNKFNRKSMELELRLKAFGVDNLVESERIPFLQRLAN